MAVSGFPSRAVVCLISGSVEELSVETATCRIMIEFPFGRYAGYNRHGNLNCSTKS
jgi:hypothetical protein